MDLLITNIMQISDSEVDLPVDVVDLFAPTDHQDIKATTDTNSGYSSKISGSYSRVLGMRGLADSSTYHHDHKKHSTQCCT